MITLSGSRVFFLLLLPFLRLRLRLCFFFYSPPFSRTVEGNHCRMLKRICIFARCCHAPLPPSTRPGSQRFFVLFVVNFLVVVLSVACNLFVYFWRRLHQIRQCRQAESFLSLSFLLRCPFCYACFLRLSVLCEFFKTLRPNGVYLTFCRRFWPLAANAHRY